MLRILLESRRLKLAHLVHPHYGQLAKTNIIVNKKPDQDYPLFKDSDHYLYRREGAKGTRTLKQRKEWKAIDRCLKHCATLKSVCDVPCGPGRLFPYWQSRDLEVFGVELSEDMVPFASELHNKLGLKGHVERGDAFEFANHSLRVDLVASVRFVYYFEPERRLELLRSLSSISNRYLLLQYKTSETWKGRRNARRPSKDSGNPYEKRFVSNKDIENELSQCDLRLLAIHPLSQFSDRAYVLAEKALT